MPNVGQFVLHATANPPLKAGDYTLQGRQDIAGGATEPYDGHLRITSPRYALPADQLLSTFPPANSEGAYENRLPQVVLKRRTLPWERAAGARQGHHAVARARGHRRRRGHALGRHAGRGMRDARQDAHRPERRGHRYLPVGAETVVDKVFPTADDLPLLCHVREVDIRDTELANGDDDGFLAVVLANRLPQYDRTADKPVRYLACLINVEGQLDVLPKPPPESSGQFLATEMVFDVRALAALGAHRRRPLRDGRDRGAAAAARSGRAASSRPARAGPRELGPREGAARAALQAPRRRSRRPANGPRRRSGSSRPCSPPTARRRGASCATSCSRAFASTSSTTSSASRSTDSRC